MTEPTPPTPPGADGAPACPDCGASIDAAAWFCESCGSPLIPTAPARRQPADPAADAPSTQTRRLGVRASEVTTCPSCGGTVGADGYCQTCGAKAPSPRDHFTESPAAWVGGVCDRGMHHHRNEDALALWAQADRAVLVVCDGVSTSEDSDVASLAAARRAREVLVERTTTGSAALDADEAVARALVDAVAAANDAVIATTAVDSANAASATFAAAVVAGSRVHYANLGDSRAYFVGPTQRLLLTVDDSLAQGFIAEGMPRSEAESMPRAHAITKWLGRDAEDTVPRTGSLELPEPGWVVVCSDGLWNYASSADELAAQLASATAGDADPVAAAQRLVDWANARGGQDNITVALARVPAPAPAAPAPDASPVGTPRPSPTLGSAPTDQQKEQPQHG